MKFVGPSTSLTWRLILAALALALAAVTVTAVATTLTVHALLMRQLSQDVASLARPHGEPGIPERPPAYGEHNLLIADLSAKRGVINRGDDFEQLTTADLRSLEDIDTPGSPQVVDLSIGSYMVTSTGRPGSGDQVLVGLPTSGVNETVARLVLRQVILSLVVLAVGSVGVFYGIRRQLRPLQEVAGVANHVAALPTEDLVLAKIRVPADLAVPGNEVGQVGKALNSLLVHVEATIGDLIRSEAKARQFALHASHELRTPLASLSGYSELALAHLENPELTGQALRVMQTESRRMTSIVEDLLLLIRMSPDLLAVTDVDIPELLTKAANAGRTRSESHTIVVAPGTPNQAALLGDEEHIFRAMNELIANAIQHTPACTNILLEPTAQGFSVHDDGPGFPEGDADTFAEPLSRGDSSRNRASGVGAGLGLSVVRAVATAHGGSVEVCSSPGDTTVTVTLEPGSTH